MHPTKGKPTYVWLFFIGLIAIKTLAATAEEETTRKCLVCKPDTNNDCIDPAKITESTVCPAGVTKCYTSNVNGVITRGCYNDQEKPCVEGDNCRTCNADDGCNKENICKTCEPSDNNCSQSNVSDIKYNGLCGSSDTKCFVNVKDKKVERRCAANGDSCSDSTTCLLCTGVNCNAGIFPTKRRQCFQCSDAKCGTAVSSTDSAKPCLNYVAEDKCYTTGTSAEAMTRGCMSDVEPKPCEESDKACTACGEDSCNNLTYKRDAKMSCIQCNTETEADCAQQQETDKAKACKEQLLYNQTESCYTLTQGSAVHRGCLFDDAKVECDDNKSCTRCSDKNGCNNDMVELKFTCIVCRSDEDKKCWNDAAKMTGKGCRTHPSSLEEGCFNGIWNGVAIRGCYVDADERMKVVCKDTNNNQCKWCNSDNDCNKGNSSGAGSATISLSLLSVMLTVFWYLN